MEDLAKRLGWTTRAGEHSEDPATKQSTQDPPAALLTPGTDHSSTEFCHPQALLARLPDSNAVTAPILLTDYKGHVFLMYNNVLSARV